MIREVAIHNFRSLRDVTVELGPLTVLVGPNASGKSSFLAAMDPGTPLDVGQCWQHRQDLQIEIAVRGDQDFRRTAKKGSVGGGGASPRVQILRLDLPVLRAAIPILPVRCLQPNGAQLTNLLFSLGRQRIIEIGQRLCQLVPVFGDLDVRPAVNSPGSLGLVFQDRWHPDTWYAADQVSDGTMLMLAFLLVPHQDPAPDLVAIEEPERGLHPWLLEQLVEMLRLLGRGELGPRAVQVVLATHSAQILEYLEPDEVRFFDRGGEDGATRVRKVPEGADWEACFEEYQRSLGQAWLSGTLGGVPGRGA
jgi:predicted ATPase